MKIYIVCAFSKTGGTKTLHQMANLICDNGHDVKLVYYKKAELFKDGNCLYDWCKCHIAQDIEDREDNIIIAPESMTYVLVPYKNIKKAIFWLSLNFYFWTIPHNKVIEKMRLYSYPRFVYPLAYFHLRKDFIREKIVDTSDFKHFYHIYNCEYARRYLREQGVPDSSMHYLCGPIENSFSSQPKELLLEKKKNIISYNVNRDKVVIKQLNEVLAAIKLKRPDIELIPIENMSREEVENTLISSKLFLDLGSFPGPERIPREAVLAYANLLIADNGAAANDIDYPIPGKYKMSHLTNNEIASSAIAMVEQFYMNLHDFDIFRAKVNQQREDFERDIKEIFSKDKGTIIQYIQK